MTAEEASTAIEADLEDRSGIGDEWQRLPDSVKVEIRRAWYAIARKVDQEAAGRMRERCAQWMQEMADAKQAFPDFEWVQEIRELPLE